jgi:hypothetical protein
MPTISFEGNKPVDLSCLQEPTTTAEHGNVTTTLRVSDPRTSGSTYQIRLLLTIEQAEYLAGQIRPAITIAKTQQRHLKA